MAESYKILRARKNFPIPACWNGLSQTDPKLEMRYGAYLSDYWQLNQYDNYSSVYKESIWSYVAETVAEKILSNLNLVKDLHREQKPLGARLVKYSHKIRYSELKSLDIKALASIYREIENLWVLYDQANVYPWFLGGDIFLENVEGVLFDAGCSEQEVFILMTPPKLSFSTQEELGILEVAAETKENDSLLEDKAQGLSDKYYWIPFGYDGPHINDATHYVHSVKQILNDIDFRWITNRIEELSSYESRNRERSKELINRHKLDRHTVSLLESVHLLAYMTDERKEYTYQAHEAFSHVIAAMSVQLDLDYKILKFVTLDEILKYFKQPDILKETASCRMENWFVMHWHKGKVNLIEGGEAAKLAEILLPGSKQTDELRGVCGSKGQGIVSGKVRILLTGAENNKLQDGEVLVTGMTTPEFVPAMRRAVAIVTDEGGVTCHAAIVSRELNKPCVIATKIATRVFKDGDFVEVDANNGVVKIIKKA